MKTISLTLSLLLLPMSLPAEELLSGVYFAKEPLTVTAVPSEQQQLLLKLPDPGISSPVYALKGMVRYDDVQGDGFLQLDSHFGDAGIFFTKGLATAGPLGKLSGSSDWRPFVLPFFANSGDQADSAAPLPDELALLLVLPMQVRCRLETSDCINTQAVKIRCELPGNGLVIAAPGCSAELAAP